MAAEGTAIAEQFARVGRYLRHWPGTVVLMHVPDPVQRAGLASAEYSDAMVIHADWDGDTVEDHRLLPHDRDDAIVGPRAQPAGRHRGAAATDVLTELHNRRVGRHRRPDTASRDHGDGGLDL